MKTNAHSSENLSVDKLFDRIKQGDENAYYTVFETHWERLYSIAFKILSDKEVAKDIVQEVFLNLWEKRETKDISDLERYLARATKFCALKEIRDDHFSNKEELDEIHEMNAETKNNLELQELQSQINDGIKDLPKKCQEVFLLSREEYLTNSEIAQKLNLSKRTVETHISNALKHLRKKLPKDQLLGIFMSLFI